MSKGRTKAERNDVDDEVDALFRLPLTEFTSARNELAARLKKSGRGDDAAMVKALGKPSISAWAVNQLYWNHRQAFDELIASGERFHKAQTSGKVANMREAIDARRESLTHLSDLATSLLQDAGANPGHVPAPDTIRRITATLEALSAFASRSGAPRPGRLSDDVDPPGFELFGSATPSVGIERQQAGGGRQVAESPSRSTGPRKSSSAASKKDDATQLAEARKTKLAAAKLALQDAKRSLSEARANAQSLEAAQKRADAEVKKAEKIRIDAEESLEKAKGAAEAATRRARSVAVEAKEAASAVEDASVEVEQAASELERLFGE